MSLPLGSARSFCMTSSRPDRNLHKSHRYRSTRGRRLKVDSEESQNHAYICHLRLTTVDQVPRYGSSTALTVRLCIGSKINGEAKEFKTSFNFCNQRSLRVVPPYDSHLIPLSHTSNNSIKKYPYSSLSRGYKTFILPSVSKANWIGVTKG